MKQSAFKITLAMLLIIGEAYASFTILFTSEGQVLNTKILQSFMPSIAPIAHIKQAYLSPDVKTPAISAKAAFILDTNTNSILLNNHGDEQLPMASTTKIMTALLAIEQNKPDELITVQQDAINEVKNNNGSNAQLVVGDKIPLDEMLYALMLPSGDDAAIAIADTLSGSQNAFTDKMNARAQQLHLSHTHYINPDGLTYYLNNGQPNPNEYTSASDLVLLTEYVMHYEEFKSLIQSQQFTLPMSSTHSGYVWNSTNDLLHTYIGALGVKTGFTTEAGYCLVFSATKNGHHIIGAILNDTSATQRFNDATTLLDWAFSLPVRYK